MKIEGIKFLTYGNSENENTRYLTSLDFNPSKSALILVDVWASHPNAGWLNRAAENVVKHLAPILQSARASGLTIIHAPTGSPEHPLVTPISGEFVVADETQPVVDIILNRSIETVFYCGYATNMCLLFKKTGLNYVSSHPSMGGKKFVILSDATIGYENAETFDGEILKRAAIQSMIWDSLPSIASTDEQFFAAGFPKMNWKPSMPMKASLNCNGTTLALTAGVVGGVNIPSDINIAATGLLASTGYQIHLLNGALHLDTAVVVAGAVRLGCMSTDSNGALYPFIQIGKEFRFKSSDYVWAGVDTSVMGVRRVPRVPAGVKLKLDLTYASIGPTPPAAVAAWIFLRDPDLSPPKTSDNAEAIDYHTPGMYGSGNIEVWCNDAGYIVSQDRAGVGSATTLALHGWTDIAAGTAN
jgi:nicotinamidase-related amidase